MESKFNMHKSNISLKVCGLTKLSQIRELIVLNIDFLGFIFYKNSPRFVLNHLTLQQISEIDHERKTGVFVNENIEKIIEISENAGLNFVQLHGDEDQKYISSLRKNLNSEIRIINVIRIGNQTADELQKSVISETSEIDYLLFDTDSKAFGGTGKTFNWNILNEIEIPVPYFLSGGISLENIKDAENISKPPFAFDINSKFETQPGDKNLEKIKEFKRLINNIDFFLEPQHNKNI